MKHLALLDSRIPIAIVVCLAAAAASAQDGIGQAHDSDAAGSAIPLGELALAGDISAPRVTRAIEADFYGAADVDDWYRITLRDAAFHPSCVPYKLRFQAELSGFTAPASGDVPRLTVWNNAVTQSANNFVDNGSLVILDRDATSCGVTMTFLINVRRPSTQATTPAPYSITVSLNREFYGSGITSVSPTSGPVGTTVTITGAQLLPQVAFQGVAAPLNTFSQTSITTTVPPGATTGPITVHSAVSQQVFTVTSSRPAPNVQTSSNRAISCCATAANPGRMGRLGRLVVAFPTNAVPTGTKVAVLKDGKQVQAGYGNQAWDLLPGVYEVDVGGKVVSNVSVQSRSDTNVLVGVLRVSAGGQTRTDIVDGSVVVASGYGDRLIGLPIGSYGLRISGATEAFTIQDGQVTDF
jgi:hypothetical protein